MPNTRHQELKRLIGNKMAIFRNVNMSFWTDGKVDEDFTPEDRYFMLYALTNQYTNIIGCYEITIKQMANGLGYTNDIIKNLLKRFIQTHKNIDYDFETKELFIKNWNKYNWSNSPKLDIPLFNAIQKVKSDKFHDELARIYNNRKSVLEKGRDDGTILIPYRYHIDTTITNTIPISIPISITDSISSNNSISSNKEELEKEFEALWKLYPNKKGKQDALKHYKKARTRKKDPANYEDVMHGIKSYNFFIMETKVEPQYIKHGSTWFNQECWNDDYSVISKKEKVSGNPFIEMLEEGVF